MQTTGDWRVLTSPPGGDPSLSGLKTGITAPPKEHHPENPDHLPTQIPPPFRALRNGFFVPEKGD